MLGFFLDDVKFYLHHTTSAHLRKAGLVVDLEGIPSLVEAINDGFISSSLNGIGLALEGEHG